MQIMKDKKRLLILKEINDLFGEELYKYKSAGLLDKDINKTADNLKAGIKKILNKY